MMCSEDIMEKNTGKMFLHLLLALKNTIVCIIPAMLSDSAHYKIAQVGDMMC